MREHLEQAKINRDKNAEVSDPANLRGKGGLDMSALTSKLQATVDDEEAGEISKFCPLGPLQQPQVLLSSTFFLRKTKVQIKNEASLQRRIQCCRPHACKARLGRVEWIRVRMIGSCEIFDHLMFEDNEF